MDARLRLVGVLVVLGAGPLACDPTIPVAPYVVEDCPNSAPNYTCQSCLQRSCAPELQRANGACADYLACACPRAADAAACVLSAGCEEALASVVCSACAAPCGVAPVDAGDAGALADRDASAADEDALTEPDAGVAGESSATLP